MYNCYIYLVYNNVQLRAHFIADVVKFTALVCSSSLWCPEAAATPLLAALVKSKAKQSMATQFSSQDVVIN